MFRRPTANRSAAARAGRLLSASLLVALGPTITNDGARSAAATGQITGHVFNDRNQNGTRDGAEPGVFGVTVIAYDSTGAAAATTTTDVAGAYTLNGLAGPSRVEFSDPPNGMLPAPAGADNASITPFRNLRRRQRRCGIRQSG